MTEFVTPLRMLERRCGRRVSRLGMDKLVEPAGVEPVEYMLAGFPEGAREALSCRCLQSVLAAGLVSVVPRRAPQETCTCRSQALGDGADVASASYMLLLRDEVSHAQFW